MATKSPNNGHSANMAAVHRQPTTIATKSLKNGHSNDIAAVLQQPPHLSEGQMQAPDTASSTPSQSDPLTYRIAIILLAVVALAVVVAAMIMRNDLSQGVLEIGATAIGGLAGIVVPSLKTNK